MSLIPPYKISDCSQCGKGDVPCRKRGKELICLICCRKDDTNKQIARSKVRGLIGYKKEDGNSTAELQRWFEARHKEMSGTCKHCGGKTQKGQSNYKYSIAHILPKAYFKSVYTHTDNWVELCFYGKSCHTNLDNFSLDLIDLNCFDEVVTRFVSIYPHIAVEERRRIPQVLMQYIETEK